MAAGLGGPVAVPTAGAPTTATSRATCRARIRLIANDRHRFDLQLELSQVDVNVELDPSTFRVTVPPGTQPISLEELRAGGPLSQ